MAVVGIELPDQARKEAIASIEIHEEEFQYWRKYDRVQKGRK